MWRTAVARTTNGALRRCSSQSQRIVDAAFRGHYSSSSDSSSTVVNNMILRSLKEHYVEASKMAPPTKVSPPPPFTVVKGALDTGGPVLKRTYKDEEISISVMEMVNLGIDPAEDDGDDEINQLFLHADICKSGQDFVLHFLCGLYPDALGIHSVSTRLKLETSDLLDVPSKYNGHSFEALDDRMRDAFHGYLEERGINHNLFPFLQAWLYVKDHRTLMRWFKAVGTSVKEPRLDPAKLRRNTNEKQKTVCPRRVQHDKATAELDATLHAAFACIKGGKCSWFFGGGYDQKDF